MVRNAGEKDTIWYCGYLWLTLTDKQIDKIAEILDSASQCRKFIVENVALERKVIETPAGMKLYTNSDKMLHDIKELIEGCTSNFATRQIFDLYNADFITCAEHNRLYDWIVYHTDGNGCVSSYY